jgi:hypothetical protein
MKNNPKLNIRNNSYHERWRERPFEVSATSHLCDQVLIPAGVACKDKKKTKLNDLSSLLLTIRGRFFVFGSISFLVIKEIEPILVDLYKQLERGYTA